MQGPETRKSLLLQLRETSDHEAWEEFVAIYEPLVYRLAAGKGLQHADAQDVTQDVLATVGKAIGRFDPDSTKGSFRGWLFRIARNLTLNFLTRDKHPRGSGDTGMLEMLEQQAAADEATTTLFSLEYQREVFRWAAERTKPQFHEETWRAFWLTAVDNEPIEQVAQMLGKTTGAIRIARCRVITKLKEHVKRFESERED